MSSSARQHHTIKETINQKSQELKEHLQKQKSNNVESKQQQSKNIMLHMQKINRPSSATGFNQSSSQAAKENTSTNIKQMMISQESNMQPKMMMTLQLPERDKQPALSVKLKKNIIKFKKAQALQQQAFSLQQPNYKENYYTATIQQQKQSERDLENEDFQGDLSSISLNKQEASKITNNDSNIILKASESKSSNVSIEQDIKIINTNLSSVLDQAPSSYSMTLPPRIIKANNKENLSLNIKEVVAQQVTERCQKLLQSAKKSIKPPTSSRVNGSETRNSSTYRSARQSINMEKPIMDEVVSIANVETPSNSNFKGNRQTNSIRKILRESQENAHEVMSTARNYNPCECDLMMNTARTNLLSNFGTVDQVQNSTRKQSTAKKSALKDNNSLSSIDSYSYSCRTIKKRVVFKEELEFIEDICSDILNDSNDVDEIDRKFRMYFKCQDDELTNEVPSECEYYDPQVCNMKESDIWKVVFDNMTLKYARLDELPLTKLDILLEKEFYDIRRLQILDEDLHCQNVQVVEQLEGLYRQNEDLEKELKELMVKEESFKRVFQPRKAQQKQEQMTQLTEDSEIEIQEDHAIDEAQQLIQEEQQPIEEDFESQWQRLNEERFQKLGPLDELPLEQSFQDQSQKPVNYMISRAQTNEVRPLKLGNIITENTSFMDVNDSFYQQFDGLITQQQKQIQAMPKTKSNEISKPPKCANGPLSQRSVDTAQTYKMPEIKVSQSSLSSGNAVLAIEESCKTTTTTVEKKVYLTSQMKAFERQYAKYEEKLKLIEDELLDYKSKSKQLEKSDEKSPLRQQNSKRMSSTQPMDIQMVESPPLRSSLKSPKQTTSTSQSGSKKEQETPSFNKFDPMHSRLSKMVW